MSQLWSFAKQNLGGRSVMEENTCSQSNSSVFRTPGLTVSRLGPLALRAPTFTQLRACAASDPSPHLHPSQAQSPGVLRTTRPSHHVDPSSGYFCSVAKAQRTLLGRLGRPLALPVHAMSKVYTCSSGRPLVLPLVACLQVLRTSNMPEDTRIATPPRVLHSR